MADNLLATQVQPVPSLVPTMNALAELDQRRAQTALTTVQGARQNAMFNALQGGDENELAKYDPPSASALFSFKQSKATANYLASPEGKAALAKGDFTGLNAISPALGKDVSSTYENVAKAAQTMTERDKILTDITSQYAQSALHLDNDPQKDFIKNAIGVPQSTKDTLLAMPYDKRSLALAHYAAAGTVANAEAQKLNYNPNVKLPTPGSAEKAATSPGAEIMLNTTGAGTPSAGTPPAGAAGAPAAANLPPPAGTPPSPPVPTPGPAATLDAANVPSPEAALRGINFGEAGSFTPPGGAQGGGQVAPGAPAPAPTPAATGAAAGAPVAGTTPPPDANLGPQPNYLPRKTSTGAVITEGSPQIAENSKQLQEAGSMPTYQKNLRATTDVGTLLAALDSPGFFSGAIGPQQLAVAKTLQSLRSFLGIQADPKADANIGTREWFNKTATMLAAEIAKTDIGSRVTNFDLDQFMKNNAGELTSVEGNRRLVGVMAQVTARSAELSRLAQSAGYDYNAWLKAVQAYDTAHPIVDPATGGILANGPVVNGRPTHQGEPVTLTKAQVEDGTFAGLHLLPGAKVRLEGKPKLQVIGRAAPPEGTP